MAGLLAGFIAKAQKNGAAYTAFDLMKFFAIFNMTVDHIGAYFFPHALWIRAIGRITFPVWFFLVGYSRSLSIGRNLWIYAALLLADHPFVGRAIFPLNALVSIIFSRFALNFFICRNLIPGKLPEILVAFVMLVLFTDPVFEYGTLACMFTIFGWMVREGKKEHFTAVLVTSYVAFVGWQIISFQFNLFESVYVVLGTAWVVRWLAHPQFTVIWPQWRDSVFKTSIAILSRNTLFYYFFHRMLFEIASNLAYGKSFGFVIKWFPGHH